MYDDGSGTGLRWPESGRTIRTHCLGFRSRHKRLIYTTPHDQLMHHVLVMVWSEYALVHRQANQSNKTTRIYYILENINVTVEE